MKICFLSAASVIHTVRWVNGMAELGHEVHLITMHEEQADKIDRRVTIHQLNIPAPLGYYVNVLEAKRLIKTIQPDLLHAHYASGYGTLARLINFTPTLLSVWGTDVYIFPYESRKKEKHLKKNLEAADYITSTSFDMKKQTEKFTSKQIEVIPFGIDTEHFKPQTRKDDETIVIGTVKKLEHVYGIDILIRVTALLIDELRKQGRTELADRIRLKIVGQGPQLDEMVALTKRLNIEAITEFTGFVPNEEVPHYLNELDIFTAFSRSESFGVAVLEASACEVPVVVSDVGGLPEVVKDQETGYCLPLDHTDEIVEKLASLVIHHEQRTNMGKQGRAFVKQHYTWKKNVLHMEMVYNRLINNELLI